jgi:hypothetical protein
LYKQHLYFITKKAITIPRSVSIFALYKRG